MDLLSGIASWLGENEATISAVVGIAVLAGLVFAGLRSLVRRRGETSQDKAPSGATKPSSDAESSAPDLDALTVPGFEGRPAIAVLPLENLSGDPDQEYFADGLTDDLITRLSAWRFFPVIARNSSFTYKGKSVDVKQVSRELGVRYVVEGSVRKIGERVRISARLDDATTSYQLWRERYEASLKEVLALQDEIVEKIVGAMHPELLQRESERALRRDPVSLSAWDCALRGVWHMYQFNEEDNSIARVWFERSTQLDSQLAPALAGLALSHAMDLMFQWTANPPRTIAALEETARRAVVVDYRNPFAQLAMANVYAVGGRGNDVITALERAIESDPSFALGHVQLGQALAVTGRPDAGLAHLQQAMRLSPKDPHAWLSHHGLAIAYFAAERYAEAVEAARRTIQLRPDLAVGYFLLTNCLAQLGRTDDARPALKEALKRQPGLSCGGLRLALRWASTDYVERVIAGLRKAGLPE